MLKKITLSFMLTLALFVATAQSFGIIKDLAPGTDDGCDRAIPIVSFKGKVYFSGNIESFTPKYVYSTDGTSMTKLTNDAKYPQSFTPSGSLLYYSADAPSASQGSLYVTDGTSAGNKKLTSPSTDLYDIGLMFPLGTKSVIFVQEITGTSKCRISVSDGTVAGTSVLGDFVFKIGSASFSTYKNSIIISEKSTNSTQFPPIITDGTLAGTKLLKDFLVPVKKFEEIESVTAVKNHIFVRGTVKNPSSGIIYNESYVTDMTVSGTISMNVSGLEDAFLINNIIVFTTGKEIQTFNPATKSISTITSEKYYFSKVVANATSVFYHDTNDKYVWEANIVKGTNKKISTVSIGSSFYSSVLFAKGDSLLYSISEPTSQAWRIINTKTGKDDFLTSYGVYNISELSIAAAGNNVILPKYTKAEGVELWSLKNSVINSVSKNDVWETFGIKAYPNPANQNIFIELASNVVADLRVIDAYGRLVISQTMTSQSDNIDISNLLVGIYTLQCVVDGKVANSTIVVQR